MAVFTLSAFTLRKKHVKRFPVLFFVAVLFMCVAACASADEWNGFTWSFEDGTLFIDSTPDGRTSVPYDGPWENCYDKVTTLEIGKNIRSFRQMGEMKAVTKLIIHSENAGAEDLFQKKLKEVVYTGENPGIYGPMFRSSRLDSIQFEHPDAGYDLVGNILYSKDHSTLVYYFDTGEENAVVPEGVRIINGSAFANSSIKSVQLPGTLVTIGEYAFKSCRLLKTVVVPASVQHLGSGAFSDCYSLESIRFEGGTYDHRMFYEGERLVIPEGIGTGDDYDSWQYDSEGNRTELRRVSDESYGLFLKTVITEIELPVCPGFCDSMFEGCKNLKNVSLAAGTERLSYARNAGTVFIGCSRLETIYIPDSVRMTEEDYQVFAGIPACRILCHSGSDAETFAQKHNIQYTVVP